MTLAFALKPRREGDLCAMHTRISQILFFLCGWCCVLLPCSTGASGSPLMFFFVSPGPVYTTLQFYFEFIPCGPHQKFEFKKKSSAANSTNHTRRKHGNEENLPRRYRQVLKSHFFTSECENYLQMEKLEKFRVIFRITKNASDVICGIKILLVLTF
jgi:hypothetical protein